MFCKWNSPEKKQKLKRIFFQTNNNYLCSSKPTTHFLSKRYTQAAASLKLKPALDNIEQGTSSLSNSYLSDQTSWSSRDRHRLSLAPSWKKICKWNKPNGKSMPIYNLTFRKKSLGTDFGSNFQTIFAKASLLAKKLITPWPLNSSMTVNGSAFCFKGR